MRKRIRQNCYLLCWRKIPILIGFLFIFSSCAGNSQFGLAENVQKSLVTIGWQTEGTAVKYYFLRPLDSQLEYLEGQKWGKIKHGSCEVRFAENYNENPGDPVLRQMEKNGVIFKSFFDKESDVLEKYIATIKIANVSFISDINPQSCIDLINLLVKNFSTVPRFENSFFSVLILPDFKFESGDDFVIFKKWIELQRPQYFNNLPADQRFPYEDYRVEIGLKIMDGNFDDLGQMVSQKFPDYTVLSVDFGNLSGILINETLENNAVSHLFFKGPKGDFFESYLAMPSLRYNEYRPLFEEFLRSIQFI